MRKDNIYISSIFENNLKKTKNFTEKTLIEQVDAKWDDDVAVISFVAVEMMIPNRYDQRFLERRTIPGEFKAWELINFSVTGEKVDRIYHAEEIQDSTGFYFELIVRTDSRLYANLYAECDFDGSGCRGFIFVSADANIFMRLVMRRPRRVVSLSYPSFSFFAPNLVPRQKTSRILQIPRNIITLIHKSLVKDGVRVDLTCFQNPATLKSLCHEVVHSNFRKEDYQLWLPRDLTDTNDYSKTVIAREVYDRPVVVW